MICPELQSEDNRKEFNGVLTRLNGKPLSESDVKNREDYVKTLSKPQEAAYNRAHYLWSEHNGEAADVIKVLDHIAALMHAAAQPAPIAKEAQKGPSQNVGVKKKDVEASRKQRGLSPVQQQMYQTLGPSYAHGRESVESGRIDPRARALDVATNPRQITPEEIGALAYDRARIVEQHEQITGQLAEAINKGTDEEAIKNLRINLNAVEAAYATNDEALRKGSRENSAGLNAMKMVVGQDYNLVSVVNRMTVAKGEPLTAEERKEVEKVVYVENQADKALQKRLANLEKENAALRANGKVSDLKREVRTGPARGSKEHFKKQHESLIAELARLSGKAPPTKEMFDIEVPRERVGHDLDDYEGSAPDVDWDATDNYGKWTAKSVAKFLGVQADEHIYQAMVDLADLKPSRAERVTAEETRKGESEIDPYYNDEAERLLEKWTDPKELGYHRAEFEDLRDFLPWNPEDGYDESDVRDLAKELQARSEETGYDEEQFTFKSKEGFPPLVITRKTDGSLEINDGNHRADIWNQQGHDVAPAWVNDEYAREAKKNPPMFDLAEEEMTAENPDVIRIIKALATSHVGQGLNTAEEVTGAVKKDLEAYAPSVTEREIADIWSGYGRSRQPNMEELATRLREVGRQQRLINALEDAEKGSSPQRSGFQHDKPTPRVLELRKAVKAAMAMNAIKIEKTPKSAEEQWRTSLQSYKKRLGTEKAKIMKKIAERDFSKKKKPEPMKLDKEALHLRGEREQQRAILEKMVAEHKKATRTTTEKVINFIPAWIRWTDLSSALVFAKLGTYALFKNGITPMEMLYSAALSKTPGLRGIYAKSPYYSGGLNIPAEMAAIKTLFNQITVGPEGSTWKEIRNVKRTGQSKIDLVYGGKKMALDPDFMEFWGRLHSALKTQPKIAEFQRAFIRIKDFEYRKRIAAGMSPDAAHQEIDDPDTQIAIGMMAYPYANRAILMNDNKYNTFYRMIVNAVGAEKYGTEGKIASALIRSFLPIVKVGTNFVGETIEYLIGGPRGLIKMAMGGSKKGDDTGGGGAWGSFSPEEADYVARNLNRGAMMATFLGALGLILYAGFKGVDMGGYYTPGEKRSPDDVQAGGVRLFGHDLPGWSTHNPPVNALQFYVTMYRLIDAKRKKTGEASIMDAMVKTSLALGEEVPFLGEPVRAIRESEQPGFFQKFLGAPIRGAILPPDVQRLARATDPEDEPGIGHVLARMGGFERSKAKRRPVGVVEEFEAVTPGLRTNVPIMRGLPDKVAKEMDSQQKKLGAPAREPDETPEEYKARVDKETKAIGRTLPEIIQSDEYRTASKAEKKKLLDFGIKEARKDAESKVASLPEERDLALQRAVALSEAEIRLTTRLGKVDKETLTEAKRQLAGVFRLFNVKKKEIEKLPAETRAAQANRKAALLEQYRDQNILDHQIDRIIAKVKAQRSAA
jgi:hypothetical protein